MLFTFGTFIKHFRNVQINKIPQLKNGISTLFMCLFVLTGITLIVSLSEWRGLSAQNTNCSGQYAIDELLPTGARWQMCWEERLREGVILYDVYYTPRGGTARLVLAQAHLAQIHVPYDDNGARYHDSTDSGLGGTYLTKLGAADCPGGQLRSSSNGSVLCQQVVPRGYAFRYTTSGIDSISQGYAINLFSISHVGEYNYIVQWQFADDGAILPSVGATGKLQRLGTYVSATQGWPLRTSGTGVVRGVGHNHNYYWKLDFDMGDAANDLVEEFDFLPINNNQERALQVTPLTVESARSSDPALQRFWRVRDKVIVNGDGHAISYEIEPLRSGNRYIGPDYEPFTNNDFYVTRQKSCEIFASHNSAPCAENLAAYVDGEDTDGQDLVLWFGLNFHHLPRDEDEMFMPAHWDGFVIAPRDWTETNPLDSAATVISTPSPSPTEPPTITPTPLSTASATSTAIVIPTETATETETPVPLATATLTATATSTATATASPTQTDGVNLNGPTATESGQETATLTPTPIPTSTQMVTFTPASTLTATLTPVQTPVMTRTPTRTPVNSQGTPQPTQTNTPTRAALTLTKAASIAATQTAVARPLKSPTPPSTSTPTPGSTIYLPFVSR